MAQIRTVALQVGGRIITRDELALAYRNSIAENKTARRTLDSFVRNFVDMQLKARAAYNARMDTLPAVRISLEQLKARLLRPYYRELPQISSAVCAAYTVTSREFNKQPLLKVVSIFRYLPQNAGPAEQQRERALMDSLYNRLLKGDDFIALSHKYSSSNSAGKELTGPAWLHTGRTWRDFETQAYTLKPGEYSRPFLSYPGFFIVKVLERKSFPDYESIKPHLLQAMEQSGNSQNPAGVNSARELEKKLLAGHPDVRIKLDLYADALLAGFWERKNSFNADSLKDKYPVVLHEKVIHTLEKEVTEVTK